MNNISAFPGKNTEIQGMTLRDYFAAKAMQAFMSNDKWVRGLDDACMKGNTKFKDSLAKNCYGMADAMLKERDEDESNS